MLLLVGWVGVTASQEGFGSIAVTVYGCPPEVGANAASPGACERLTDGFGVRIYGDEGIAAPLTTADAEESLDGSLVWDGLMAAPGGTGYRISLNPLPDGYGTFVVTGDVEERALPPGRQWGITLFADAPDAVVTVYALAAPGAQDGAVIEQAAPSPFGAALHTGDCGNLGERVTSLGEAAFPAGPAVGDEAAIPIALGSTTVDVLLDEAIDGGYAVVIYETTNEDAPIVACGEVGGVDDDDGLLAVGLREVGDSRVTGVASLSYGSANPAQTDVSLSVAVDLDER